MALLQCRDKDGWQWTSRSRDFDLSLCAEEGFILSSFLAILIVAALVRLAVLSFAPARDISRKSHWRLWAKLVGVSSLTSLARAHSVFRHFLVLRSKLVSPLYTSFSPAGSAQPFNSPMRSSLSRSSSP